MTESFQYKINWLFQTAGRRVTNAEVAKYAQQRGRSISAPYISQLRNGIRTNPSFSTMCEIAGFFQIDPEFFLGTDESTRDTDPKPEHDHSAIDKIESATLRTLLRSAADLSPAAQKILLDMAAACRSFEKLSPFDSTAIRTTEITTRDDAR